MKLNRSRRNRASDVIVKHGFHLAAAVPVGITAVSGAVGTFAARLWYNLAATHNAAATIASQKENWKFPETRALTVKPILEVPGSVTVAEPVSGMFKPKCPATNMTIISTTAKLATVYNGFR